MNEDSRDFAEAFVEFCLDNSTSCASVGICAQFFDFCANEDLFEQILNAHTCLCGHSDNGSIAAPFFGSYAVFCKLREHSVGICAGSVHLVHSNDDRHVCLFCVADSFESLRHNAVVGSNNEDCNIRNLCAASTHRRKRFVSRRIEERDGIAFERHGVCADMLRNAARFAARNVGLSDVVEK